MTTEENIQATSGIADTSAAHEPHIQQAEADVVGDSSMDLSGKTFADFGVSAPLCEALKEVDILHPFPIQALTLPVALERHDIIGQAKTGTGKTLGFALPALENVIGPGEDGFEDLLDPGHPQALIVLPTRELAIQVARETAQAAAHRSVRICEIYGGRAFEPQIADLKRGVEIVVGTPGRLIDLMKQGHLSLSSVRTMVLDEADEMLDLGFLPDVEVLLSRTPANRHTMLFSATMPGEVVALARRYMSHPTHIRAQDPDDQGATVKTTRQVIYRCHALNKIEVVARILQARERGLTIIFTRTKRTAARVAEDLGKRGFATASLHGDLGQGAREQALRAFRHGKVDVLVATDVAARGIDVDDVTHVINYQCPEDAKIYIHRIGRTGRAGNSGTAITFVDWDDVPRWKLINKELSLGIEEPVETYHTSTHLYTDLDIPEDAGGRLPLSMRKRAGLAAEKLEDLGETGGRGRVRSGRGHNSRGRSRRGKGARGGRDRRRERDSHQGAGTQRQPRPRRARRRRRKGSED
ncbi:DEAD/DEAH box helicase [Varibaculum massiliense]|uniref:DEAD/DEAH box helicase n=1 Tax=Varibaculum massiliense TaxID=1852372 RepID=UPI001F478F40|nr:DEAD/DEAH box helicase [Varibaculum massiliense]